MSDSGHGTLPGAPYVLQVPATIRSQSVSVPSGLHIHVATVVEQYAEHVRENSRCTSSAFLCAERRSLELTCCTFVFTSIEKPDDLVRLILRHEP